jgi:RND family efflux transporter MFP subunit
MRKFQELVLRYKWWFALAVVAAFALNAYFSREPVVPYETTVVSRGNVLQEVSVTGRVVPFSSAELSFERGGKVAAVLAQVGDSVKRGDVLVRLDSSELLAQRAQAKANLDYEIARLAELRRGARPEELSVSLSRVRSAESALADARSSLLDKITIAIDAMRDGIFAKTDSLYENPRTTSPKLLVPIPDQRLVTNLESTRLSIGALLDRESMLSGDELFDAVRSDLVEVKRYLDELLLGVSSLQPSASYGQASIDTAKTNILAARTSVASAQTSLLSAGEKLEASRRSLDVAQKEYELARAPATPETILAQEARIAAMEAALASIDAQIAKNELRAPFSGVVTRQDAKRGENIAANRTIVMLQSTGEYKIEANVPEVDVAKVAVGDPARVTLDAYGSAEFFPATVSAIDPAETVIEGVPTYTVTLRFDQKDERIKSGMTANIDIRTDQREGVLYIPARAVLTDADGRRFVRVPDGLATRDVPVEVGLRGSDGRIEILSGLSEGDVVVTFLKKAQ